jgi:sulfur carrier protein
MQITVNGQPQQLATKATITQLLAELGLDHKRIAIEVNKDVISRSNHNEFRLSEGDYVEIIQAVGGG